MAQFTPYYMSHSLLTLTEAEFCVRMNNASNYIMLNKAVSKHMELPPVDLEKCNISPRTQVRGGGRVF